jgi:hypothetical protein
MRVPFRDLFEVRPNGMIAPKVPVKIGGSQMSPGTAIGSGKIAGVDLRAIQGRDLEVEVVNGVYVLKGNY